MYGKSEPDLTRIEAGQPDPQGVKSPPPMVIPDYPQGQVQIQHEVVKRKQRWVYLVPVLFFLLGMPLALAGASWAWNKDREGRLWNPDENPQIDASHMTGPTMQKIDRLLDEGEIDEAETLIVKLRHRAPEHQLLPGFIERLNQLKAERGALKDIESYE